MHTFILFLNDELYSLAKKNILKKLKMHANSISYKLVNIKKIKADKTIGLL